MTAREDDNFRQMLRQLATPRPVDLTDPAIGRRLKHRADRRKQGLPAAIRDVGVVNRVAALIRAK